MQKSEIYWLIPTDASLGLMNYLILQVWANLIVC